MKKAKKARIRPLAICVFRHEGRILVSENYDPGKQETFYRPLGGGIEFGERGIDAAAREIHEELDATVRELTYLGTLENVFTYDGRPGHEIVLVYDGAFVDAALYGRERLTGREGRTTFEAVWKPLTAFVADQPLLYPDGLLELLSSRP
ncbi:MAG: NUDIX hydrolase [Chloroflexota bacterium]|nr:NUDIX hydrolase [Chloroflexota bacterium]